MKAASRIGIVVTATFHKVCPTGPVTNTPRGARSVGQRVDQLPAVAPLLDTLMRAIATRRAGEWDQYMWGGSGGSFTYPHEHLRYHGASDEAETPEPKLMLSTTLPMEFSATRRSAIMSTGLQRPATSRA